MIKAKTVTIVPTSEKDEDGYKTAIIPLYDSTMPEDDKLIKRWLIDSFSIHSDRISCDFEGSEGIRMWSTEGYLQVVECYGPIIYSLK